MQQRCHGTDVVRGLKSQISLDFPNEYLVQVRGTTAKVGFLGSKQVITSLTFITSKHTYGPYGAVKGTEFGTPPSRLVTGFHGQAGDSSLDRIGFFTTVDWETTYTYLERSRVTWSFSSTTVVEGSKPGRLTKDIPRFPKVDPGHDGEFVINFPQGGSTTTSQRPGSTTIAKTSSGGTTTTTTTTTTEGTIEQPKGIEPPHKVWLKSCRL